MDSNITLKAIDSYDLSHILRIQSFAYEPYYHETFQSFYAKYMASPSTCLLAQIDGQAVGYIVSLPVCGDHLPGLNADNVVPAQTADALYLHDLAIHPEFHQRGIAALLLQTLLELPDAGKCSRVILIAVQNSSAFWKKHGFRVLSEVPPKILRKLDTYGNGAVFMERKLTPALKNKC